MRDINLLVIHCSWTKPDQDIGVTEIRGWHVHQNNWSDIGYHKVIRRNGEAENGRPIERIGAHVAGHNSNSIGICLVGGRGADCKDETNFTEQQWQTLRELVRYHMKKFPGIRVVGHNELTDKKTFLW